MRVVVYENPYARIPLSRNLFCDSFDERWGEVGGEYEGYYGQVFIGKEAAKVEADSGEQKT
jgi:hypothetical protein